MIKKTKKEILELQRRSKVLREIVEMCKKEHLSGIIFDKDLGHSSFFNCEMDRYSLIEIAKTEDEFVKQMRQFSVSQMVKSYHDNVEKMRKGMGLIKDNKPSYMG